MNGGRYDSKTFVRELLMILVAALFVAPLYLLVVISLKTTEESFTSPVSIPNDPQFGNFVQAWEQGGSEGMGGALISSLIITIGSVVLLIVLGALTGYVIARRTSGFSNAMYIGVVIGVMLPFQLGIIPAYVYMRQLGLIGNYGGMILLYAGVCMPLAAFLYTGFIRSLPVDYEEAARVDGASLLRLLFRVVIPLLRPVTGTVAIICGVIVWNDFFIALIFLGGSDYQTLPVALYSFVGQQVTQWNLIFAAVVITMVPPLTFYLFAQRQLIRGFAGGIRG